MSEKLTFSMPEQLGVMMNIFENDNRFELELHSYSSDFPTKKLTDDFLEQLCVAKKNNNSIISFSLYTVTDEELSLPVTLSFEEHIMRITSPGKFSYTYHISFDEFFMTFCENVKKYALYYAAPANYKAFFCDSFDDMVAKFERYRDKEHEILQKISLT